MNEHDMQGAGARVWFVCVLLLQSEWCRISVRSLCPTWSSPPSKTPTKHLRLKSPSGQTTWTVSSWLFRIYTQNPFVFQMERDASCSVCELNLFSVLPRFHSLVRRPHFVLWWVLVLKSEHKNTHCNVVACPQPLVGTVEVPAASLLLHCAHVRKQRQLCLQQRTVQRVQHGFVCRLVQAALKAWWQCSSPPPPPECIHALYVLYDALPCGFLHVFYNKVQRE